MTSGIDSFMSSAGLALSAESPTDVAMDGRRPMLLDQRGRVFQITSGHADVFAVDVKNGQPGARHHLLRIENGDIIPDLPDVADPSGDGLYFIAVGSGGSKASLFRRTELTSTMHVLRWIERLARFVAGPAPRWQMAELAGGNGELTAGECRRGPMRGLAWLTLEKGALRLMGLGPTYAASSHPLPLTSGLWVEAGTEGCTASTSVHEPEIDLIWPSIDQFHLCIVACVRDHLLDERRREGDRLVDRTNLAASQTREAFDRLSGIIVRRFDHAEADAGHPDRLVGVCRIIAAEIRTPISVSGRGGGGRQDFAAVVEVAQASRLRVRQVLLRDDWWKLDAGPLVGWYGEKREPVALIYQPKRGYVMIEPQAKLRRHVNRSVAMQIIPEAATFYPPLPARPLKFRDLLQFAIRHARGNGQRIAMAVIVTGLLSLATPLITNVLISSIIPRSELDQLAFCALALGLTALSMAGTQVMQGLAMLRLEATIDWRLQSALIDRLLKLPASIFREYTAGDLVDRSMGIDAARRALTGRALRGMLAGLFCLFSIGLMFYYDVTLAVIAVLLTLVRAFAIVGTSLVRLHYENAHFNLQGKVSGFVLQLLTGVGKLRVAAATARALGIWSKQFAVQKRYFVSSQIVGNGFGAFETAFPTIATMIIFACVSYAHSKLATDIGAFFAFFSAFGQSMGSIGSWATGISETLIALPPLLRLRPLIACAAEVSDARKSPGELSGSVELARVSFRYLSSGPPVLDNVSLKISPVNMLRSWARRAAENHRCFGFSLALSIRNPARYSTTENRLRPWIPAPCGASSAWCCRTPG